MKDQFGREIDYIRISVTDRCNLRCGYCMPSCGIKPVNHSDILRFDEIVCLVNIFAGLGIKKVKLTGGEPLVRKGLPALVKEIKAINGIEQVTLTTNGVLVGDYIKELAAAGLDSINISLDTLNPDKYEKITGFRVMDKVLEAIALCEDFPQLRVKINAVTLKNFNEDDIVPLALLAKESQMDVRFIEMMPIGLGRQFEGYSQKYILDRLTKEYGSYESFCGKLGSGPALYYHFKDFKGQIGFISAMTHGFCQECNRIRLTSEGLLKPCLQYSEGVDLRQPLRTGASDRQLSELMKKAIFGKPAQHSFGKAEYGDLKNTEKNIMSKIGG